MEEIYLDIRNYSSWIKNRFPKKDYISLEELLGDYEELILDLEHTEEELKDLEQDIQDNYRPIPYAEQVGISNSDFI